MDVLQAAPSRTVHELRVLPGREGPQCASRAAVVHARPVVVRSRGRRRGQIHRLAVAPRRRKLRHRVSTHRRVRGRDRRVRRPPKHRTVAEATALLEWRLAPVWPQARAELAKHTRKPDEKWGSGWRPTRPRPWSARWRPPSSAIRRAWRRCGSSSGSSRPTPRRYARRSQAYVREAEVRPLQISAAFPREWPNATPRPLVAAGWGARRRPGSATEDGPERLPGSPASVWPPSTARAALRGRPPPSSRARPRLANRAAA